ncbi:MAG: T9SS type A sorting domain-containing protein [Bacteroidetes bacterium]|nr:T9SS type A sorting domain-containing protein [Bacteroidota bacterium]
MKALLFSICLTACIGLISNNLQAQVHPQVIIANGGVYGPSNIVKIASWDLLTRQYTVFDSFPASSVQDVTVHERFAYVCADSILACYNLDTYQRTAMVTVPGVRQTRVHLNYLLVTKGYGAVGDNFEVRDMGDLSLLFSIPGISGECEGVASAQDTAYIAVPQGFGASTGKIAVVSLASQQLVREIDLDTNGRVITDLFINGGKVYSINQIDFFSPYSIVSTYDIATADLQHHRVDMSANAGIGVFNTNKLYAGFGAGIGGWDLNSKTLTDTNIVTGQFAAIDYDEVNHRFYGTKTDYFTYGKLYEYNGLGVVLDSIDVGISPEAIAADNYVITSETPSTEAEVAIKSFPQPFGSHLNIDLRSLPYPAERIDILDLTGRVVMSESMASNGVRAMETTSLVQGTYLVRVTARGRVWTTKIVKAVK